MKLSVLCKLAWDTNTDPYLAGYRLYYGIASKDYDFFIDVGKVTEYSLFFFNNETPYYIALTAYDIFGNESDLSQELIFYVNDGIPDYNDNCPEIPNGPNLGTCTNTFAGLILGTGFSCTGNNYCNTGEICQMHQEDYNGNGIGDVCECHADFDNDHIVNSRDLLVIKLEIWTKDCLKNLCLADINNSGKVDSTDLLIMKIEYNRNCPTPL
jgi:hypothetical protein